MDENALIFQQVRSDIQEGNLSQAEELLNGVEDHCAEWYFLMGAVYCRIAMPSGTADECCYLR